ncbi:MAG: hypothetical protein JW932_20795 [Deltaproteobacteria bacterium]|nr:hypothetical protein [Deltaproteobacteria bacterium]
MAKKHGRGQDSSGKGRGMGGGQKAQGPGGYCVCTTCGHRVPHERGEPCFELRCEKCGASMTRE